MSKESVTGRSTASDSLSALHSVSLVGRTGGADPCRRRGSPIRRNRVAAPLRREQHDDRALGVDRLVIIFQRDVVDASALQRDRAGDGGGVDGDALALGERGVARLRRGFGVDGLLRPSLLGGGRGLIGGVLRGRLGLLRGGGPRLLGDLRLFLLPVELGEGVEKIPAGDHQHRQAGRDEDILRILVHDACGLSFELRLLRPGFRAGFRPGFRSLSPGLSFVSPSTICAVNSGKGAVNASGRATKT